MDLTKAQKSARRLPLAQEPEQGTAWFGTILAVVQWENIACQVHAQLSTVWKEMFSELKKKKKKNKEKKNSYKDNQHSF